jgi:hypothetical protein
MVFKHLKLCVANFWLILQHFWLPTSMHWFLIPTCHLIRLSIRKLWTDCTWVEVVFSLLSRLDVFCARKEKMDWETWTSWYFIHYAILKLLLNFPLSEWILDLRFTCLQLYPWILISFLNVFKTSQASERSVFILQKFAKVIVFVPCLSIHESLLIVVSFVRILNFFFFFQVRSEV